MFYFDSTLYGYCQGSCSPPPFACLFCIAVSLKMRPKWSSEDVVKFLDVYEESEDFWNIRHSDYNNKIKRDSAMFPPPLPHYISKFFT